MLEIIIEVVWKTFWKYNRWSKPVMLHKIELCFLEIKAKYGGFVWLACRLIEVAGIYWGFELLQFLYYGCKRLFTLSLCSEWQNWSLYWHVKYDCGCSKAHNNNQIEYILSVRQDHLPWHQPVIISKSGKSVFFRKSDQFI